MRRAALEKVRTRNEWLKHWKDHVRWNACRPDRKATDLDCACDQQQNRFRKRPWRGGCGCGMCTWEKLGNHRNKKARRRAKMEIRKDAE